MPSQSGQYIFGQEVEGKNKAANDSDYVCSKFVNDECMNGNESYDEWSVQKLIKGQDADEIWGQVKAFLKGETTVFPTGVRMGCERFVLEENVLYLLSLERGTEVSYKTVIPKTFIRNAIALCHCHPVAGHLGIRGTMKRVRKHSFWIGMNGDIEKFVKSCHICMCFKPQKHVTPPARIWPSVRFKWVRVHLDLIGPLPTSYDGNRYIMVIIDEFTRFTVANALKDKSALSVAQGMKHFCETFSYPEEVISDNGSEFMNRTFKELMTLTGTKHEGIIAYRPSSNGLVERVNGSILSILRHLAVEDQLAWDKLLHTAQLALNTAYHSSVGDTPYFLVFQQDPKLPYEVFTVKNLMPLYDIDSYRTYVCNLARRTFELTTRFLERAKEKNQKVYDLRHKTRDYEYELGDSLCKETWKGK